MIYPLAVEKSISEQQPLGGLLSPHVFPNDTNKTRGTLRPGDYSTEVWLATEGRRHRDDVRQYLEFLSEMHSRFAYIQQQMHYDNPDATHHAGHDRWTAGCSGDYMVPIAAYLYYLHSRGVQGAVLECGVFKGASTCCLSWICKKLGLKLYAADSFEGLPATEGFYGKGDFKGSYAEVKSNLDRLSAGGQIELIKGWYADSLKGFNENLSVIWLDVDLKQSVLDALGHTFGRLLPNGIIFSDGLTEGVDFAQNRIKGACGEPGGLVEFFASRNISYKAMPGGPRGLGLLVPHCGDDETLLYEYDKLTTLVKLAELPAEKTGLLSRLLAR
jgi:hypothetical protein